MTPEKLKSKYLGMDSWDRNKEFEDCVKASKYEKVKFFLETDYIRIPPDKIKYGLFLSCINNDVRMFKYLMFKQNKVDLNTAEHWIDSLKNSCSQTEQKVLKFILKTPLNPVKFNDEHFYQALLNTGNHINGLLYLVDNNLVDIQSVYKNDSEYLKKLVTYARVDHMEYLAYKHEVSFTPFKELAESVKSQYRGEIMMDIIRKQNAQELFAGLDNNLNNKTKTKAQKI